MMGSSDSLISCCLLFGLFGGYLAGTQPGDAGWRWFSYHPFFMTLGFVGLLGSATHRKKLGGYVNTKMHGILASVGVFMALGGLYVIYTNKEMNGKPHLTSNHSLLGITAVSGCVMAMLAGGIFLHPDFGIDKANQTIRAAHKWMSRGMIALGWVACFTGINQMTNDITTLALFGLPLLVLAPFTLV